MPKTPSRPRGGTRPTKSAASTQAVGGRNGQPRAAVLAAAAVAVVLVVGVGFFVATRDAGPGSGDGASMEHIHGLGVDPADGTLYAGTHFGLFRISPDGEDAERVADRVQDFMGFTVAGPNRFLASGHPGEGQDGPGSLGLIESTDKGETWTELSLAGEADFHALEYRHDRVYGLNAMTGQFMVSDDMRTWETRSDVAMADFAVSPTDPETLLATTQDGLARSADGGRSFDAVADAPVVLLVDWADDGTVAAATPDGVVYTSRDAGTTWTKSADLGGAPEALTVESATEIYAAANGTVLASRDGGRSFTTLYPQ